jgi:uncharacterized protein YbjT (DUF2867 family)
VGLYFHVGRVASHTIHYNSQSNCRRTFKKIRSLKLSDSVLVFGASGTVGKPLVRNLLDRDQKVLTASRSGKTVEGATAVTFEFGTSTDFDSLLNGVNSVFLLLPSGHPNAVVTLSPLIESAARRSLKIVYLSAFGAGEHEDHDHHKVEQILKSSGTAYVSLRPNWFSDNFHTFWKSDVLQGNLRLPAAQGKTGFIDARDIAACAVVAFTTDKFDGRAIELTGPEALDYAQAADILSAAMGKAVTYTRLSEEEYIRVRTSEGMPPQFAKSIAQLFAPVRAGEYGLATNGVFEVTGFVLGPLRFMPMTMQPTS